MRVFVPSVVVACVAVLVACSNEPYSAGPAVGVEDDVTGTQQAGLCTEMTKLPERCGEAESGGAPACVAKLASACDGVAGLLNPRLVDAAASCVAEASCDAAPSCLAKMAGALEPTDAQTKLAKAFCSSCSPVSGAACESTFLSTASPLGKVLLPLGDSVASAIESDCTTGLTCAATFASCAQGVVASKLAESLDKDAVECLLASLVGAVDVGGSSSSSGGSSSGDASSGGASSSGGTPRPTTPPPTNEPTWDLYITSIEAPETAEGGAAWDAFGGLPDLVVTALAEASGSTWSNTLTAPTNTRTATFTSPALANVPSSVFTAPSSAKRLRLTLSDADVAFHDPVGDCALGAWEGAARFSSTSWSLGSSTVTCSASATGGPGFKLTYSLRAHAK